MAKRTLQSSLYQKRGKIKQDIRPLKLNEVQRGYIVEFVQRYSGVLKTALILLFAATVIEILIPLVTNFYIKKFSSYLDIERLAWSLGGLVLILIGYLVISFFSIKAEKTFTVEFMNFLRRKWFSGYLNKSLLSLKGQDKGRLLTKISFHFSLLQMGLTNCVFSIFSWTFLSIGLVFSSFFLDTTLLMIVLVSIPASAFLGFIGYIVSKYYISQDQTLYSRILMYINETLEEFPIVKTRNKERQALVHFDKLVKLDSYFRVRRDLWLKYGGKIIFMMIALFGGAVYLFEIYYPFLKVETSAQYVVYGIFFGLVIKLFYMALRIGLFSFPVKLGAAICVPDEKVRSVKSKPKDLNITNISFGSQKIRLGRGMDYVKNLRLEFEKGGRYLVSGSEGHGKTTVGHAIAGLAAINQARPWVIRLNGRRFLYSKWPEYANNVVFVGNEYKSERTLLESLSNEDTKTVKEGDFKKVISVINSNKHFAFLLDNGRAVGRSINGNTYSGVEKALLEMAYCMISRPKIVVIDNVWLDIDDSRINDTLKLLDKSLEKSIIVCLSTRKNKILEYDKEYSI